MRKYITVVYLALFVIHITFAQDITKNQPKQDVLALGLGAGQIFGGFGSSLSLYPVKNLGLFGALGWNLAGAAYNAGVKIRFPSKNPEKVLTPYALGMYGYNAVVIWIDDSDSNRSFYGPTFGFGVDYKFKPSAKTYWTTCILVPVRSDDYKNYTELNELKGKLPFSISFGCHIPILHN